MNEYETLKNTFVGNFKILKEKADKAVVIKYSTKCSGIGYLFPAIYKKICKSQYGRIITNIEKLDSYAIFEFDENNTPLRIRKIHNGVCTESIYWYRDINILFAACFIGDTDDFMVGADIFKFVFRETKLYEFSFFNGGRKDEFIFDYSNYPHIKLTENDICYPIEKITENEIYFSENAVPKVEKYEYVYDELPNGKICNIKDFC